MPKRVYAKVDWERVLRLRKRGMSINEVAARLGVPYSTVQVPMWLAAARERNVRARP